MHIEILNWQIFKEVPSASGIVKFMNNFYLIGDDSPYLYCVDGNFNLISKKLIYSSEKLLDGLIPKFNKPDFEAMEMISENEMLIFGSGSKSPERDVCVWVRIVEQEIEFKNYDISKFYDYLRNLEFMHGYELDIEGLAVNSDVLFLMNRGNNVVFSIVLSEFLEYCRVGLDFPIPKIYHYSLPKIKSLRAGFSGATVFRDNLIFTASVEDSPNAYEDGEIFGSFLGIIKIRDNSLLPEAILTQIPNPGFPLKIESVIVDNIISEKEVALILVTDNDGAPSQILRMNVKIDLVDE